MRRRSRPGRFAERTLDGVDDRGVDERIVFWIERRAGALWVVGRSINPQLRSNPNVNASTLTRVGSPTLSAALTALQATYGTGFGPFTANVNQFVNTGRVDYDALMQPESRQAFRRILNLGFTDAIRARYPEGAVYTFWDYTAGCWQRDAGFRIDHLLLSAQAADRLRDAGVDKGYRGRDKASDHAPTWVEIEG